MEAQGQKIYDFYVRAVEPDSTWAQWISWHIECLGFSVYAEAFVPGQHPYIIRNELMHLAQHVIFLFSHDAEENDTFYNDWIDIYNSDPIGKLLKFIPIRVRPSQNPSGRSPHPSKITYIILSGLDKDTAEQTLYQGIDALHGRKLIHHQHTEPPFPGLVQAKPPHLPASSPSSALTPLSSSGVVLSPERRTPVLPPVGGTSLTLPPPVPSSTSSSSGGTSLILPTPVSSPASPSAGGTSPTLSTPISSPASPPSGGTSPTLSTPKLSPGSSGVPPTLIPPSISAKAPNVSPAPSMLIYPSAPVTHLVPQFVSPPPRPLLFTTMQIQFQQQLSEHYPLISAWTPNGSYFAALEDNNTVRIWDRSLNWGARTISLYIASDSVVRALAYSRTGEYLAFVNGGDAIYILATGPVSLAPRSYKKPAALEITHLAWSPDDNYLASASTDKTVRIWNSANGTSGDVYWCEDEPGLLTWSLDQQLAYVSGETIHIRTLSQENTFFEPQGQASFLAWSPDSQSIGATVGSKVYIGYLNHIAPLIYNQHAHNVEVSALAWSPNGAYIASVDTMHLHIWYSDTGKNCCIEPISRPVRTLVWPDDNEILLIYIDGSIDRGEITF